MKKNGVICAVDVNDFDQDVIDLAANMAKQFGVNLDLLHITLFPNTANRSASAYVGPDSVYSKERRRLKGITTTVEGVQFDIHHLSGYPGEQILGFVERHQPRLLIVGTHGRQGLARIFGSVASFILRNATCPVMVFRQSQNDQHFNETSSNPSNNTSSQVAASKTPACDG